MRYIWAEVIRQAGTSGGQIASHRFIPASSFDLKLRNPQATGLDVHAEPGF